MCGVCLGHDNRVAGGVLVVSVIDGELREVCSAKALRLGKTVRQAWSHKIQLKQLL